MATSGSWNYSVTAADVIKMAMEDIGVLTPGETISAEDQDAGLRRLNYIVKQWQGDADMSQGMKVWTRQRITLFLAKGQQKYLVGPAATDARATTAYGRTTISTAEAVGQTAISITATTDTTTDPGTTVTMTASDIIGIEQNDGTMHWSTIVSTGGGPIVTINDATSAAAAAGNYVYWFTSRAQRFPVIDSAVLRDENRNDTLLRVFREASEYDVGIVDKYADGDPTCILVEPLRIATRITLDSQPTGVDKQIVLSVLYPAEDYDAAANDIAYPQEYFAALEWELAKRCAPMYGRPWTQDMNDNWKAATGIARNLNPQVSNACFEPNP